MKRILFLLFISVLISSGAYSQVPSGIVYPEVEGNYLNSPIIRASFYDTLNEVLYIGGVFDSVGGIVQRKLAAIDLRTGMLLPWSPIIGGGDVYAIIKSGNTVYIGGSFTSVNSTSRNNLAALDAVTSDLLTWAPNPDAEVFSLAADNSYLYVGGYFTNISGQARTCLATFNLSTGYLNIWDPPLTGYAYNIKKILLARGRIYVSIDTGWDEITELTFGSQVVTTKAFGRINDYVILKNSVFFVGNGFVTGDSIRNYSAAINLNTGDILPWNPVKQSRYPEKLTIESYRDTIFIAGDFFDSYDDKINKYSSTGSGVFLGTLKSYPFNMIGTGYLPNNFIIVSDKLIEFEKYLFKYDNSEDVIHTYCFAAPQPANFTVSSQVVCKRDTIEFTIPGDPGYESYIWSYDGLNVTIDGNTNSINLITCDSSTSGTLRVKGMNFCGLTGNPRSTNVGILPDPPANAGPDDSLSCTRKSLTLTGTSGTNAIFQWSDSTGPIGTAPSVDVQNPGTYTLTIRNSVTNCTAYDYVEVHMDTVSPLIEPFDDPYEINCKNNAVLLNGSTDNINDSIRWVLPGGYSASNPYEASEQDLYECVAMNRRNGCESSYTVEVIANNTPPEINVFPITDTLSCNLDTMTIEGSSSNPDALLYWISSGDTLPNPANITKSGSYAFHVLDTVNGCKSQSSLYVYENKTLPHLYQLSDTLSINCSFASVLLDASSLTPKASLTWNGPKGEFNDPDTTGVPGTYYITARDSVNGCFVQDSIIVDYKPLLFVDAGNDTLICNSSSAILTAKVTAGTFPFSFNWNNGTGNLQSIVVNPATTTRYEVNINDGKGCSGTDSITVFLPEPIKDSIVSFQPCSTSDYGQLQVYASGGIPPYRYSLNGNAYQSLQVFDSLDFGTYDIAIKDSLGCLLQTTAEISGNSLIPQPDFLVSTNSMKGDTLVFVDISNPRPDTLIWIFPASCQVINDDPFAPIVVYNDTGEFMVEMKVFYNDCIMLINKTVNVSAFDTLFANAQNNNGIESIVIYPNPNNGQFNLEVKLYKKQSFIVLVNDASGVERFRQVISENDQYQGLVNIDNPISGTYLLRVIAEYDSRQLTFIITQ